MKSIFHGAFVHFYYQILGSIPIELRKSSTTSFPVIKASAVAAIPVIAVVMKRPSSSGLLLRTSIAAFSMKISFFRVKKQQKIIIFWMMNTTIQHIFKKSQKKA